MTDTGDVETLEELEPLAEGPSSPAPGPVAPPPVAVLPAPAYNPVADKEYYRFLFAGVIMFIGCLMPFGPQVEMVGYKTLRGAMFMVIALGIIWSSWASISNRRMVKGLLRWIFLAMLPFALGIVDLLVAFYPGTAVAAWIERVGPENSIENWGEFFEQLGNLLAPGDQCGEFVKQFGPGRLVVFAGAVLSEIFLILAVFGGVKAGSKQKAQQAERRAAGGGGSSRRRK